MRFKPGHHGVCIVRCSYVRTELNGAGKQTEACSTERALAKIPYTRNTNLWQAITSALSAEHASGQTITFLPSYMIFASEDGYYQDPSSGRS